MSTTWADIARPFWKRETDLRELLGRRMMLERGQLSPYDMPLGKQLASSIAQAADVTMGQLAPILSQRAGLPGQMVQEAVQQVAQRATGGTAQAVSGLYQYYNPTALAVERARLGLQLANLRNQFYHNQIIQDAMNEQSGGGILGGIGGLIGGVAKLAGGLFGFPGLGNLGLGSLGSLLGGSSAMGGLEWLPMAGAMM